MSIVRSCLVGYLTSPFSYPSPYSVVLHSRAASHERFSRVCRFSSSEAFFAGWRDYREHLGNRLERHGFALAKVVAVELAGDRGSGGGHFEAGRVVVADELIGVPLWPLRQDLAKQPQRGKHLHAGDRE